MDWVLSAAGWLILAAISGVVGNAIWDISKPRIQRSSDFLFRLLTLNQKRSRDGIYLRAAQLNRAYASNFTLTLLSFMLGGFSVSGAAIALGRPFDDPSGKTVWEHLEAEPVWGIVVGIPIAIVLLGWAFLLVRLALTNQQVQHVTIVFEQACTILTPDVPNKQLQELRKRFALMQSEDDHSELWREIRTIAADRQLRLPF